MRRRNGLLRLCMMMEVQIAVIRETIKIVSLISSPDKYRQARTCTEVKVPTTTQDTTRKESVKGNPKMKEYKWRKIQYQAPSVDFIACVEEGTEGRFDWMPYMYFKQFVTDEMLQETVEETNLYSVQKEGKSVNTTAKKIEQVLGMYTCIWG